MLLKELNHDGTTIVVVTHDRDIAMGMPRRVETSLRTGTLGDTSTGHRRFTVVFEIGAKVIYPSHGVAEIVGRESQVINGASETYLVLLVVQPGWGTGRWMKVSLPEDRAEGLGVRAAISREDASDVIELLGMSDVHVPGNWSRRFKNHQEKLRSGDVYACAEVVRTSPSASARPRWPLPRRRCMRAPATA